MSNQIVPFNAGEMKKQGKAQGWMRKHGNIIVENERLGYSEHHVMWETPEGQILYDQILRAEKGGGVFVVKGPNGTFGLQMMYRPQTQDMAEYRKDYPRFDYGEIGRPSLETPRGFAHGTESGETATMRETREETQSQIVDVKFTNDVCSNTALDPHFTKVGIGTIDPSKQPTDEPDPNEKIINGIQYYTIPELIEQRKQGNLYCAFTLAAIFAAMLEDPEEFFKPELL